MKKRQTAKAGRELAIKALRAFERIPPDDQCSSDRRFRPKGKPQNNLLLRFLERARKGGPEVERGFASILTDHLQGAAAGVITNVDYYARQEAKGRLS